MDNGLVTVWVEGSAAGQISLTNDGNGLDTTLTLHSDSNGIAQVWFRHSDIIPPAATLRNIDFNVGSLTTGNRAQAYFRATTRKLYTYPPGTLGLHASEAIDTRIAGKNPATALAIFSTQDHSLTAPVYVRNTESWCYDIRQAMTCISPWYSYGGIQYGGTAITPQHIITSAHIDFLMEVEDKIRFITANNVVETRIIKGKAQHPAYQQYYTDLTVYTLDSPLPLPLPGLPPNTPQPGTITPCKILPANYANYLGNIEQYRPPVIVLNQQERARVFDLFALTDLSPLTAHANTRPPTLEPDREAFYEASSGGGDSGNPIFLIVNNSLVLLTTQTNIGVGTFVTPQLSALNTMIVAADANATALDPANPINTGLQVQTIDLSGFNTLPAP